MTLTTDELRNGLTLVTGDTVTTSEAWPADWRSVKKTADKLVILGHSPSTRDMAPYDDPTYEIWGLNDDHGFLRGRRTTRHFEIHTRNVYRNPDRRTLGYLDYMQSYAGPVYMLDPDPTIPHCVLYPKEYIEARYGRVTNRQGALVVEPVLTSGFSYMIAIALEEGFKRIEFYGADLMGEEEYIRQREGFAYLYGLAQGRGVEIVLPDACPILRAPLYGQNPVEGSGLTEDELSNGIAKARKIQSEAQTQAVYQAGVADTYVKLRAKFGR